jgi:hypothetical protein
MEYEVWRDERNCRHFRVKCSTDDMLLKGWDWSLEPGRIFIWRFDMIHKKHRQGFCSDNHPLVLALGLERPH